MALRRAWEWFLDRASVSYAPLFVVLAVALVARLPLTPLHAYLPDHYSDETDLVNWMRATADHGVLNAFNGYGNIYIAYTWVLWLQALVYGAAGGSYAGGSMPLHLFMKVPPIAFDLLLIGAVYAVTWALRETDADLRGEARRAALVAAAIISLHPAIVYVSAVWAQIDALLAAGMLASLLLAARGRVAWAWAIFALTFLVKPQPVVMLPVLVALTLHGGGLRALVRGGATAAAAGIAVTSPWLLHGNLRQLYYVERYLFTAPPLHLSGSAWNIWLFRDMAAHPRPGDRIWRALPLVRYRTAGLLAMAAAGALGTAYAFARPRLREALIAATYLTFAFYMLPVGTHERYVFPVLALLLPVALGDRRWLALYLALSLTVTLDFLAQGPPLQSLAGRAIESPFGLAMAGVNTVLFAGFTAVIAAGAWPLLRRVPWRRERGPATAAVARA